MGLYKKPDSPYWWVDIRIEGLPRVRKSTKQKSEQKARQIETALIHQLNSGDASGLRQRAPLLRDFAEKFLDYVKASRRADKTKRYYQDGWRLLSTQPISRMRLDGITTSDAEVIQVSGGPSNLNCALRTLKRMLRIAEEKRLIQRVPRIPLAEENERSQTVTADLDALIIAKAPRTVRDAYMLIADCGIRPDDAASIGWEDVDFIRGEIFIRGGKTGKKAQRYVAMSSRVRTMLVERARLDTVWVFASHRKPGLPLSAGSICGQASRFKREAGLPAGIVLYSARHTFATDITEATGNLSKTQKALGHSRLTTTARYNHSRSADVAGIIDARNSERHVSGHGGGLIQ